MNKNRVKLSNTNIIIIFLYINGCYKTSIFNYPILILKYQYLHCIQALVGSVKAVT